MMYYVFANNLPVIESKSIKWLIKTLKACYPNIGNVVIKDSNLNVVKTLTLLNKKIIEHHAPRVSLVLPTNFNYETETISYSRNVSNRRLE